ncbi:MAG: lysoplasmalogenase [Anaerolineae bacterium]|jgi:uncharacterized membrane protein YhhN|nr:lysoplasmalogenase [Anaerolineae bacterium]
MNFLLALTLLSAIVDWYAVYKGWKKLEYILKPLTVVFLFSWLLASTGSLSGITLWFGIGLILSMAGDIFLMLPKEQFIAGLVAFLLAHVAYIVGFNLSMPPFDLMASVWAILIGLIAARLYQHISAGLTRQGKEALQKPVFAYTAVISIMLLSALLTIYRPDWEMRAALVVSLGATLFMISDAILAWNKFVTPIKHGRVKNMAAYHLGQIILIYGIVMQVGM